MEKKKILLVDDDVDFVEINRTILEKNGYEVHAAYNAEEGVKKTHEIKPDLIILDVMMGKLTDGFFASYDLKHTPDTKDIPILMVTSVNDTVPYKFEPDDQYLPVDDFVEKPINSETLLEKVQKLLEIGKSRYSGYKY